MSATQSIREYGAVAARAVRLGLISFALVVICAPSAVFFMAVFPAATMLLSLVYHICSDARHRPDHRPFPRWLRHAIGAAAMVAFALGLGLVGNLLDLVTGRAITIYHFTVMSGIALALFGPLIYDFAYWVADEFLPRFRSRSQPLQQ